MVLIGLLGIAKSGKTTGAKHLISKYNFIEKTYADPLKIACKALFLLDDIQLYGTDDDKQTPDVRWFGCTPRKMMQYVGTDLLRNQLDKIMPGIKEDVFIHHFKLWYLSEVKKNPNLCIILSDVRFQNEVDFIQSLGGSVIKIDRPSVDNGDTHQSEAEIRKITSYNYLVENTGTLEDYLNQLEKYTNVILKK